MLDKIRVIPDFPKEGISFYDITSITSDPKLLRDVIDQLEVKAREVNPTAVVAMDARGFIFGAPVADRLGIKFIPARKPGKLPSTQIEQSYDLEYGSNTLCMHDDALSSDDNIVIVDDLLATGGTALATAQLVEQLGATVDKLLFVIDLYNLDFLPSRKELAHYTIESLVQAKG